MTANIIRVARRDLPYAQVSRATLQDARLSLEARGLLGYLLSLSDHWEARADHLCRTCGVGRDKLQRILRELQAAGYVRRERTRDPQTGVWLGQRTMVYERPEDMPATAADADADDVDFTEESDDDGAADAVDAGEDNNPVSASVACSPQPENPVVAAADPQPCLPAPENTVVDRDIKDLRYKTPDSPPHPAAEADGDGPTARCAASSREDLPDASPPPPAKPIPDDRKGLSRNGRDDDPAHPPTPTPAAGTFWTDRIAGEWAEFQSLWPFDPAEDRERARKAFGRLGDADRGLAVKHAADHARALDKGRAKPMAARAWLGARVFAQWADGTLAHPREPVFVIEGTPAFDAWANRWRAENGMRATARPFTIERTVQGVRRRGMLRDTLFPPRRAEPAHDPPADDSEAVSF